MQVKPGYKQTDVGVIPEDWEVRPLVDIAKIRSGIAKNSSISVSNPVLVHYLRVANVQDGFLDLSEMSKIRVSRNDIKRYEVLSGDMLMNEGGDLDKLGRGSLWRGEFRPCVHQNHVFVVRCGSALSPDYLNAWTGAASARRYFMIAGKQTTNLASINKTALGQLPVALPTKAEQEAIAEALSDADALIESLEQLLVKKHQLKQGAMQELLTGKKRLPGFSGDWEVKAFGEIFDYHSTATNSRSDLTHDGDTYYVHYGDIHTRFHGHLDFEVDRPPRIERSRCRNAAALKNGDWVMADASEDFDGVGKSIEILGLEEGTTAVAGLHTFLLREKTPTFAPRFKGHLGNLKALHAQLLRVATGMKVFGVSKAALRQLLLPVPPTTEQTAIAAILSDMDAEIAALETKLAKARQIKQGMMQELLTGRIRLI